MKLELMNTALSTAIDKIGLGSMLTFVGIEVGAETGVIELAGAGGSWGVPDYAMLLTCVGSTLFCLKLLLEIYVLLKKARKGPD